MFSYAPVCIFCAYKSNPISTLAGARLTSRGVGGEFELWLAPSASRPFQVRLRFPAAGWGLRSQALATRRSGKRRVMARERLVRGYISSVSSGARAAQCAKMPHIYAPLHPPNIPPNILKTIDIECRAPRTLQKNEINGANANPAPLGAVSAISHQRSAKGKVAGRSLVAESRPLTACHLGKYGDRLKK